MPHDCNKQEIKKGDIVLVKARVRDVSPCEDYCNCTVENLDLGDGHVTFCTTLNTGQVQLCPEKCDNAAKE